MRRGNIVTVAQRGEFTGKPRPGLIVQTESFIGNHPTIHVCPLTSRISGAPFIRIIITPDGVNGLQVESEIQIDLMIPIRRERVGAVIGWASEEIMFTVDQALRRWLAL